MTDLTATVLETAGPLAALCAALGVLAARADLRAALRPALRPIAIRIRRR